MQFQNENDNKDNTFVLTTKNTKQKYNILFIVSNERKNLNFHIIEMYKILLLK